MGAEDTAGVEVTVVVPTYRSARTIAACVRSAKDQRDDRGRPYAVQVVVVDNHSDDGTAELAAAAGADVVLVAGDERCAQRNTGWRAGVGATVLFVDSDMVLGAQVCAQAHELLVGGAVAAVVPERSFGSGYWSHVRGLEKLAVDGDARTEAARAYRRDVLEQLGGWDETLVAGEDWDLSRRAGALGAVARTADTVLHDEGRATVAQAWHKKRYYGEQLARTWERDPGAQAVAWDPGRWAANPGVLVRHPVLCVGLVVLKTVDACAVWCGVRSARRHRGG